MCMMLTGSGIREKDQDASARKREQKECREGINDDGTTVSCRPVSEIKVVPHSTCRPVSDKACAVIGINGR